MNPNQPAPPPSTPISAPLPAPLLEITADRAIALARWWWRLGLVFNVAMVLAVVAVLVIGYERDFGTTPIFVAGFLWVIVMMLSARSRRLAIDAMSFIAAGDFGQAEHRLSQSLASFSILRSTKLLGLQQLATLRHAQKRYADSATLADELLANRGRNDEAIEVPTRLMLAESLLEVGDVRRASDELARLARSQMNLRETLLRTHLTLDWQLLTGHFDDMVRQLGQTLPLVELMPAPLTARSHAALAVAAQKAGATAWAAFLSHRARLLGDVNVVAANRPILRDAFDDQSR